MTRALTRSLLLSRRDIDFLLHEWLNVEELTERPLYAQHDRTSFDGLLDLAEQIATREFAPHNRRNDIDEPWFDGTSVHLHDEVAPAIAAFRDAGLFGLAMPERVGGLQLPVSVAQAAMAWFQAANVGTAAYPFLTAGNAALLLAFGTPEQVEMYVKPMVEGRFFGTMCLSEPQAGSSLADITTRAEPKNDGSYRLFGNKMWISGGDHELSENIVHLVLAKIPGGPAGSAGISLFLVPKHLPDGQRNDVVLAGVNHKLGYRGTVNTLLNFGEGRQRPDGEPGARGWLVGEPTRGLAAMFHMMNEARLGVGLGATALGYTGYLHALEYARQRTQGRPLGVKDATTPMVPLTEHADVRRMLLSAKSYVEGALALQLYCAKLVDDARTEHDAAGSTLLLDVLTPIAKSWPSQWCLKANDLAIQVHGGYGYTREYPVEQFYRDNRLNPIHEGTHGVQGLDLLGRKVTMAGGAGLTALGDRVRDTSRRARAVGGADEVFADAVLSRWETLESVTRRLHETGTIESTLCNASAYLEAAGHIVLSWIWLEQLLAVGDNVGSFYDGKRDAAQWFLTWELPTVDPVLRLLAGGDRLLLDVDPDRW